MKPRKQGEDNVWQIYGKFVKRTPDGAFQEPVTMTGLAELAKKMAKRIDKFVNRPKLKIVK